MIQDLRVKMADQDDSRDEKVTSLLQVRSFKFMKIARNFTLFMIICQFLDYQDQPMPCCQVQRYINRGL